MLLALGILLKIKNKKVGITPSITLIHFSITHIARTGSGAYILFPNFMLSLEYQRMTIHDLLKEKIGVWMHG